MSWLIITVGGPRTLWAAPSSGQGVMEEKTRMLVKHEPVSEPAPVLSVVSALSYCWAPALISIDDVTRKLKWTPKLLLVSVFSQQQNETRTVCKL